jgi:hypothetical protein
MKTHQSAKAAVPVMALEINNESAANLIQSVTFFPGRLHSRVSQLWLNRWRMSGIEVRDLHHGGCLNGRGGKPTADATEFFLDIL